MASRLQDYLRPTTLHQAVNVLLETISSAPVVSLDAIDTNTDAEIALKRIAEVNRECQQEGWPWNQEIDYEIAPNAEGHIILPLNRLKVVQKYSTGTSTKRLVERGPRLYDARNHTFVIGLPVKVDLTVLLDFEDLPEAARWYTTIKAARRFATGKIVSPTVYQITKKDEDDARVQLEQAAAETDPDSLLQNPHFRRTRWGK